MGECWRRNRRRSKKVPITVYDLISFETASFAWICSIEVISRMCDNSFPHTQIGPLSGECALELKPTVVLLSADAETGLRHFILALTSLARVRFKLFILRCLAAAA